jgi:parvulin-like peptidyl-prolyl isomerase
MAALVNDEPIFLANYEKELARYERAQAELGLAADAQETLAYRALVLDALVERVLISQAAADQGIVVTPAMVDEKLAELQTAAGDSGNFAAWLEANLWSLEEFREALAAEMLAEKVVSVVTADVPSAVEQVRARYLQVDDLTLAQSLLQQIRNGEDFGTLAGLHSLDKVTGQNGGELGYFARGSLLVPAVETAAFNLNPGEVSEIITGASGDGSQTTYYIVQLIERDPQRPLTADLRYTLLQQAFETWLQAQWERATVIRLVNTDA